mmetsp:Transcript_31675/g.47867  ORF Transcript_31675/g.47867 Transcript_31675/m.47867 type:complete len:94 (-) Transcript_31675:2296-2577(-)
MVGISEERKEGRFEAASISKDGDELGFIESDSEGTSDGEMLGCSVQSAVTLWMLFVNPISLTLPKISFENKFCEHDVWNTIVCKSFGGVVSAA